MKDFEPFFRSSAGITHFRRPNADGTVTYAASQEVDEILDANKAKANHNDGYTASRDMRRVASIPYALIMKWRAEEGWDAFNPEHAEKLKAKLNSSEFAYLRTAGGTLDYRNGTLR